jgi:hypothetical protein
MSVRLAATTGTNSIDRRLHISICNQLLTVGSFSRGRRVACSSIRYCCPIPSRCFIQCYCRDYPSDAMWSSSRVVPTPSSPAFSAPTLCEKWAWLSRAFNGNQKKMIAWIVASVLDRLLLDDFDDGSSTTNRRALLDGSAQCNAARDFVDDAVNRQTLITTISAFFGQVDHLITFVFLIVHFAADFSLSHRSQFVRRYHRHPPTHLAHRPTCSVARRAISRSIAAAATWRPYIANCRSIESNYYISYRHRFVMSDFDLPNINLKIGDVRAVCARVHRRRESVALLRRANARRRSARRSADFQVRFSIYRRFRSFCFDSPLLFRYARRDTTSIKHRRPTQIAEHHGDVQSGRLRGCTRHLCRKVHLFCLFNGFF